MTIQQLVVDLENEPGRLFSVTEAISSAAIEIYALALTDYGSSGSARMLVSDVKAARAEVMALDVPARMEDVLVLRIPSHRGSLSELLEPLYDDYVNVLSLNAVSDSSGGTLAVVRFNDNVRAEGILREHGHEPLGLDAFAGITGENE